MGLSYLVLATRGKDGIFIAMAILWGWKVNGIVPDRYDLIGGAIALLGIMIIMFAPRP
jgi:small multidrug resistance family-3 protein